MKTTMITALTTVLFLSGCACATTEYKVFEGSRVGVMEGKGGSKVVVNGMEIWDAGEPPRKFKILGFIDDNRKAGWWGEDTTSVREDVVEKARGTGGDALVKINTQFQLSDYYKAGGASVSVYGSYASPAYGLYNRNFSKYAVIKYLR
ncbi:MAG: hypothetical protein ACXV8J_05215 [Methylobacter sp.]